MASTNGITKKKPPRSPSIHERASLVDDPEDGVFRDEEEFEMARVKTKKKKRVSLKKDPTILGARKRAAARKRSVLLADDDYDDEYDDDQNGIHHSPNVVSELMGKLPARPRLQRKLSKPEEPMMQRVGILGSDYAVYLVCFLVLGLFLFVVVEASMHGVNLFGSGGNGQQNDGSNGTSVRTDPSAWMREYSDVWYLDSTTNDEYLNKVYFEGHLESYRDLKGFLPSGMFSDMCGRYRFDRPKIPPVSIVVGPVYRGVATGTKLLSATVHAILARTPSDIVSEIIVIHEQLEKGETVKDDDLDWELQQLDHLSELVKIVRFPGTAGPVRARIDTIEKVATGELLVVMDPYVEVWSSTWLEQLILPVLEYPRTISVPLSWRLTSKRDLDPSGLLSTDGSGKEHNYHYYGMIDNHFDPQRLTSRFDGLTPSDWEPYPTPFFESSVFAVRREEFLRLGLWDHGLERFGGDNLELAFKYWSCHGRVVTTPCVHVGHTPIPVYFALPPISEENKALGGLLRNGDFMYYGKSLKDKPDAIMTVRNLLRVVRLWMGDHAAKQHYYEEAFGAAVLPPEWKQYEEEMDDDDSSFDEQEIIKEKLECNDFEWFDKHVLMSTIGVHHPWWVNTKPNPHP